MMFIGFIHKHKAHPIRFKIEQRGKSFISPDNIALASYLNMEFDVCRGNL